MLSHRWDTNGRPVARHRRSWRLALALPGDAGRGKQHTNEVGWVVLYRMEAKGDGLGRWAGQARAVRLALGLFCNGPGTDSLALAAKRSAEASLVSSKAVWS